MSRCDQAGLILADALLERAHGHRPVTLIGFSSKFSLDLLPSPTPASTNAFTIASAGARVIYQALVELGKAGPRGLGIVQDAIIIGCPASASTTTWSVIRRVVAGRLVNAYSASDWVLKFCFRAAGAAFSAAGLSVVNVDGVENVDLTDLIESHHDYLPKLQGVLEQMHVRII